MQKIGRKPGNRVLSGTTVFKFFAAASALFALFVLMSPCPLRAQMTTADVVGTVSDPMGAVVPGAKVTVKNTGTGISRTTQSGKTGEYNFNLLQTGAYEVKIEAKGFKTYTANKITLMAGDRAHIDAKMEIGQTSESVLVTAESSAMIHTDTSAISSVVPEISVQDAPLNGRNLISLVQMAPGVSLQLTGSRVDGSQMDDKRQSSSYVVNSQPDLTNNNMIDGMDNNDRRLGVEEVKPSIDAIQEVKVSTNLYSAEMGRTGGGVVEVITKSGTNKFHGSAYEYMRNDMFDAKDRFWTAASGKPTLRQNQFGASLGGPVIKNKTFFFTDFEILRKSSTAINNQTVPDWVQQSADGPQVHLKDLLAGGGAVTLYENYAAAGGPPGGGGGGGGTPVTATVNPTPLALEHTSNRCTL